MYNFEGRQPTKTLDKLWSETHTELKFKIAAVEDGHSKEDVQQYFKDLYATLTPIQKRRLRKKKIMDIIDALQDDRTLQWIANRLFVSRQCVHDFHKKRVLGNVITGKEKDKSLFN